MWPVIVALVFTIALGAYPTAGDGWYWEVGNGIGFVALALLLFIVVNGRGGLGPSVRHRWLGIATLLSVLAHSLWFLLGDPLSWEYLKWGAPHYMVAGLLSAGLLGLVTITSLASLRNSNYKGYPSFKKWHRWFSLAILISAVVHVALSGFYLPKLWQVVALVLISLAVVVFPKRSGLQPSFLRRHLVLVSIAGFSLFLIARVGIQS